MVSDKPIPVFDQPCWEPIHNPNVATTAVSCFVTNGENNIYYLGGSQTFHKYNCETDGWVRLADSPISNSTACSAVYTRWAGHFGQAISGGTRTISGAFGRGKSIIGKDIRIIGGTGAGQVRRVTAVSEPVIGDFIRGTSNGQGITDYNKYYTKGKWKL